MKFKGEIDGLFHLVFGGDEKKQEEIPFRQKLLTLSVLAVTLTILLTLLALRG